MEHAFKACIRVSGVPYGIRSFTTVSEGLTTTEFRVDHRRELCFWANRLPHGKREANIRSRAP